MKRARPSSLGRSEGPAGQRKEKSNSNGPNPKRHKQVAKPPKLDPATKERLDEDEAKLEALVFGGGITSSSHLSSSSSSSATAQASGTGKQGGRASAKGGKRGGGAGGAAWEDEDDRAVSVDIAATSRLRKLRQSEDEFEVSGKEYAQRLRDRHQSAFLSKVTAAGTTSSAANLLGGALSASATGLEEASSGGFDGWATLPSAKRRAKNAEKRARKARQAGGEDSKTKKSAWGDKDEDEDDSSSSGSDGSDDSDSSEESGDDDDDSFVTEEAGEDDDDDGGDDEDEEALLRGASSILAKSSSDGRASGKSSSSSSSSSSSGGPLPPGTISVTRVRDANRSEPSKAVIQALQFHHGNGGGGGHGDSSSGSGSVVFTAGLDHKLRFFAIDGKKNPKVASVFFPDLPISSAAWSYDGNEVICSGRRPFFYSYDCGSGSAVKIPRILGRDEKSLETMIVQQPSSCRSSSSSSSSSSLAVSGGADCPPLISFLGNDGGIILVSQRTKTWVSNLKMNGSVRAACFTKPWLSPGATGWSDLLTVGGEGEVYRWDLRMMGKCLYRHQDEGLSSGTAIAASDDGRLYAVGSASGVVNVYDCASSDIQRRYSTWAGAGADAGAGGSGAGGLMGPVSAALPTAGGAASAAPKPLYTSMLLTTSVSHLSFSPGKGELLSIGSQKITDSYRLLHTATGKAFGNWPTAGTPLHYVTCSAFSPHCGYVAIGNDRGKVLLYRLNHYLEA